MRKACIILCLILAQPALADEHTPSAQDFSQSSERKPFRIAQTPPRTVAIQEIQARSFEASLSTHLKNFVVYPVEARVQGIEGEVLMRFRMDAKGTLVYSAIEKSSGSPLLDKAAIDATHRASPFPPDTATVHQQMSEFLIPIGFHLDKSTPAPSL